MTKDDIIRMAKEAGIYHGFDSEGQWDGLLDFQLIERRPLSKESIIYGENRMFEILERFFHMAQTAEREECAKVCEERESYNMPIPCPDGIAGCCVAHYVPGSRLKDGVECAAAIRARGQA